MKKMIMVLAMLICMTIPLKTYAAERSISGFPSLDFSGTTANCKITVRADNSTDEIEIVVKLQQGNNCIATWTDSGSGYLLFKETATVEKGKEYTLIVDTTINGKPQETQSTTKKCE